MWSVPAAASEYKAPAGIKIAAAAAGPAPAASGTVAASAKAADAVAFSSAWKSIRISEVYAHPVKAGSGQQLLGREWVEVWNTGSEPLVLTGWKVRVGDAAKPKNSNVKTAGTVAPGGRLVLTTELETFTLRDDGNRIALVAPDGAEVSFEVYPKLKAGESWNAEAGCIAEPTPEAENAACGGAAVLAAPAKVAKAVTAKKTSGAKQPKPEFVLAQHTLESLAGANGETLEFGRREQGGFWQAFTFFLAAVSLCQGALMCLVAWKSGLLAGTRKLRLGPAA
jgi:hypothetical protein